MRDYFGSHVRKYYTSVQDPQPGLKVCTNRNGWQDYFLGEYLVFSHRITFYNRETFPDKLHTHTFYELDIIGGGDVSYIANEQEITPRRGNIVLIPPGVTHTARLISPCEYDRTVFYFDPKVLQFLGGASLPGIFHRDQASCLTVPMPKLAQYSYLLSSVEYRITQADPETAPLMFARVIELLYCISTNARQDHAHYTALPSNVVEIKSYIDENYATIGSVADLASQFFYSREHISRIFKYYFNTSITEYLMRKRIEAAKAALDAGDSVTNAFTRSGYRSMSTFIEAFRTVTGLSPSAYKKDRKTE